MYGKNHDPVFQMSPPTDTRDAADKRERELALVGQGLEPVIELRLELGVTNPCLRNPLPK